MSNSENAPSSEIAETGERRQDARKLRSRAWFDNPDNVDMTALSARPNFSLTGRSSASPRPVRTCRRATATIWSLPTVCVKVFAKRAASPSNFRCIRSRKPASARPRALTAT